MVCTNCQSKEVIRVQDELFCTNCGHTMADPIVAAAHEVDKSGLPEGVKILADPDSVAAATVSIMPETSVVAESTPKPSLIVNHAVATVTEKPKKRKVGRPKASRLDTPVMATSAAPRVEPKPPQAPSIHASGMVPMAGPAPVAKNLSSNSMNDLRPAKTKVTESTLLVADNPHGTQTKIQSITTGDLLAESWQGRFKLYHSLFALIPASIIALISGGVAAAISGPKSGHLIAITKTAAIPVIGALVILLALYYVCRSLATGAITFAAARSADHRKTSVNRWWGVAINSFGGKLRFDLMMFLAQIGLVAVIVGLVVVGGSNWPIPGYVQISAIFGAFIVLLYGLTGLALTQGLGRVSVVLGNTSPDQAFSVGWGFFRNHFELVGAKLLSIILELFIVIPLLAAVILVGWDMTTISRWWFILAFILAVAIGGALIGAGTAIWWESAYRQLVHSERIGEAVSLLTGRKADKARRLPLILITMLITFLVVAATVWPWLPWPTLNW
jgi:hypothetical protein